MTTNILGIIGFGENPAACLVQDGHLVAFAAEERFTRLKGSEKMFPAKAVSYCLSFAKLKLSGIQEIAFAWDANQYPWAMLGNFGKNYIANFWREKKAFHRSHDSGSIFTAVGTIVDFVPGAVKTKIYEGLRSAGLSGDFPPITFVPHHLAHAYSTYFCSPFERAGILTIDGSGEHSCTQLAIGDGDSVRIVETFPIPHSLGWFYAAITQYLGFIPYRDEGKLMGLAALGESRAKNNPWLVPLSKILKITTTSYEVDPIYTKFGGHYYADRFTDALVQLLTAVNPEATPIAYGEKIRIGDNIQSKYLLDHYVDLAWAAQELLEQAAVMLAKKLVVQHGLENICVAGGVAMNCKMNGEILRRSGAKEIFVQPASSDDGTAIGAALYVAKKHGAKIKHPLKHVFYGPGFSQDEIETQLKGCKVNFRRVEDPAAHAADLLHQGKIIAWFQGRMEFGSRSLGGRSILANPSDPSIKERVNRDVKYRENWRPFCPSLIAENAAEYLVNPHESSFMIVAYHATPLMAQHAPAAVHVDGTVRPQCVEQSVNPLYHSLISGLGKKTGHPIVLNTSFNVRGEPIVCTPLEAVRCFYSNGLDALVIGDCVLTK